MFSSSTFAISWVGDSIRRCSHPNSLPVRVCGTDSSPNAFVKIQISVSRPRIVSDKEYSFILSIITWANTERCRRSSFEGTARTEVECISRMVVDLLGIQFSD